MMNNNRSRKHSNSRGRLLTRGLALAFLFASITACVSVNIGPKKGERSSGIEFKDPQKPFEPLDARGADAAWQNRKNGNTISFQSTCNDPNDPSLQTLQSEVLSALDEPQILRTENTRYNAREALTTEAEGLLDGVKTKFETMIFKKNNCIYTLSFVGVAKAFAEDQKTFHEFLSKFEAR